MVTPALPSPDHDRDRASGAAVPARPAGGGQEERLSGGRRSRGRQTGDRRVAHQDLPPRYREGRQEGAAGPRQGLRVQDHLSGGARQEVRHEWRRFMLLADG